MSSYVLDMTACWPVVCYMTAISFVGTIFYIFILRWAVKPILYTSLVLIAIFVILAGVFAWTKVEEYKGTEKEKFAWAFAICIWVLGGLYLCFLCCNWRNIRLGASILVAASMFVMDTKRIVFIPLLAYFC